MVTRTVLRSGDVSTLDLPPRVYSAITFTATAMFTATAARPARPFVPAAFRSACGPASVRSGVPRFPGAIRRSRPWLRELHPAPCRAPRKRLRDRARLRHVPRAVPAPLPPCGGCDLRDQPGDRLPAFL